MKANNITRALIYLIFILLIFIAFLYEPKISGYVTVEKITNYTQKLNWDINESHERTWFLEHPGNLKSVRISGSMAKDSSARVYIEHNDKQYLIFDSNELSVKEGIGSITGAVIANETEIEEEVEEEEIEEEIEEEEVEEEGSTENNTITINLEYKSGTSFDTDDDGYEIVTGAIDLTVEDTEFNWDVIESNLCTRWSVYSVDNSESTTVCYGSERCCNFVDLAPTRDNWNEALYLTYGSYGSTLNNNISAQVIYVDYSLDPENPYSYIYYSNWSELPAEFYYERIIFSDICIESCLLSGFNKSLYNIIVEIDNGDLIIEDIDYSIKSEKVNEAPIFDIIPNQRIEVNNNLILNLSEYAYDPDNDSLTFSSYKTDNLTVLIEDDIATIIPDIGFKGLKYMFFIADDSITTTVSNIFKISIEKVIKPVEEKTVQVFAEIGKPVKWVKKVKINESVDELAVNITRGAANITVKKVIANKTIEVDKDLIRIIENEIVSTLDEYNAKITGAVIAESGEGLLTKWLRPEITGAVIAEIENISVNLTGTNITQVIIGDNATEYEIEYYTDAPQARELNISPLKKQVIISSILPYQNVLSYTEITESPAEAIRLYWYVNESEYNEYLNISSGTNPSSEKSFKLDITNMSGFYVSLIDQNNNSLIDKVQWVAPHLSNQTFEISISILNVQSYPMVKGDWTVRFTTIGVANLTISAVNQTSYSEVYDDNLGTEDDLEISELRCGNNTLFNKYDNIFSNSSYILENSSIIKASESLNQSLDIKSFFFERYNCSDIGYFTVKVLTPGVHNQEFRFGIEVAYANNLANNPPITDIIVFSDMNATKTYTVMAIS